MIDMFPETKVVDDTETVELHVHMFVNADPARATDKVYLASLVREWMLELLDPDGQDFEADAEFSDRLTIVEPKPDVMAALERVKATVLARLEFDPGEGPDAIEGVAFEAQTYDNGWFFKLGNGRVRTCAGETFDITMDDDLTLDALSLLEADECTLSDAFGPVSSGDVLVVSLEPLDALNSDRNDVTTSQDYWPERVV